MSSFPVIDSCFSAPRHSSANQYTFMHSTSADQQRRPVKGCTTFGASTSIATDTPIFTIAQNMTLTAPAAGDSAPSRLVMPRAISSAGSTTTAAP